MALKRITPPSIEPVTLDEAKLHCRVDSDDEDSFITSKIKAAREYCEDFQKRSYLEQTWELTLDAAYFDRPCITNNIIPMNPLNPFMLIELPRPPLMSIQSFKYYDVSNNEIIVPVESYFTDSDSEPGRIMFDRSLFQSIQLRPISSVKIRYIAGVAAEDISTVSEKIRQSILLLVGFWYKNRETVMAERGVVPKELEFAVSALLGIDRMVSMV